ncbi:MAG: hypothetical protein CRU72_08235 [Candidatus Accumulibacter phosphatis]|nr:hypothetical protein [Candidatus Accumulibacter phosphatis]
MAWRDGALRRLAFSHPAHHRLRCRVRGFSQPLAAVLESCPRGFCRWPRLAVSLGLAAEVSTAGACAVVVRGAFELAAAEC